MSQNLEDYEVLSILGSDIGSSYYKVKNKEDSIIYVWKAISIEKQTEEERQELESKIQKNVCDSNFLQIYDCINYDNKVLYLVTEYCEHGNLYNFIQKCVENHEYIEEDFLKAIVYELALMVKTCNIKTSLSVKNVFLDGNYNLKIMNVLQDNGENQVYEICAILYQLAALRRSNFGDADKLSLNLEMPIFYSEPFKNMVQDFITKHLDCSMETIIHHPLLCVINLKEKQQFKNKVIKCKSEVELKMENEDNQKLETRLRNIHKKESHLKGLEEKLNMREREITKKERKVALMERMVKEKMRRADLYFKSAQNSKSSNKALNKPASYEKFDTSFSADCGDSSILPTSAKMFSPGKKTLTRSYSEKKIKFRGHSPLKDIHYNYNRHHKAASTSDIITKDKVKEKSLNKRFSKIFSREKPAENKENNIIVRPISWTEENKKQAFELLKTLDNKNANVKHTFM